MKKVVNIPVDKEALDKSNENESKVRLGNFVQKLRELQAEFNVEIYAVNQAQQNGEVIPTVKIIDKLK